MNEEQRLVQKQLRVLEHAKKTGNVRKTYRYFGIARSSFYRWKRAFDRDGESGLVNKPRPLDEDQTPAECKTAMTWAHQK